MKLVRELPLLGPELPAIRLFQCGDCGQVDMVEWPEPDVDSLLRTSAPNIQSAGLKSPVGGRPAEFGRELARHSR